MFLPLVINFANFASDTMVVILFHFSLKVQILIQIYGILYLWTIF